MKRSYRPILFPISVLRLALRLLSASRAAEFGRSPIGRFANCRFAHNSKSNVGKKFGQTFGIFWCLIGIKLKLKMALKKNKVVSMGRSESKRIKYECFCFQKAQLFFDCQSSYIAWTAFSTLNLGAALFSQNSFFVYTFSSFYPNLISLEATQNELP